MKPISPIKIPILLSKQCNWTTEDDEEDNSEEEVFIADDLNIRYDSYFYYHSQGKRMVSFLESSVKDEHL
jgi:hypothetical protein